MEGSIADIVLVPKGADPRLRASPPGTRRPNLAALIAGGAIAALLTGSRVVLGDIDSQPDLPFAGMLHEMASGWQDAMTRAGLAAPDRVLHAAMERVQNKK